MIKVCFSFLYKTFYLALQLAELFTLLRFSHHVLSQWICGTFRNKKTMKHFNVNWIKDYENYRKVILQLHSLFSTVQSTHVGVLCCNASCFPSLSVSKSHLHPLSEAILLHWQRALQKSFSAVHSTTPSSHFPWTRNCLFCRIREEWLR